MSFPIQRSALSMIALANIRIILPTRRRRAPAQLIRAELHSISPVLTGERRRLREAEPAAAFATSLPIYSVAEKQSANRPGLSPNVAQILKCRCRSRRSEEHTSELQSLAYLVCRLLLEKKNGDET